MPYIKRNDKGKIKHFSMWDKKEDFEYIDEDNQELQDYLKGLNDYISENTMSYIEKRTQSITKGGYGSAVEQLEFIYDKVRKENKTILEAIELWLQHCDAVKERYPKE